MRYLAAIAAAALLLLAGCSDTNKAPVTTTTSSPPSTTSVASSATSSAPAPPPAVTTELISSAPPPEPVIVSCQAGTGPIETHWSNGTVTGWSNYCQQQHDQALQRERVANPPQERQISWCGTNKNVYNRGTTFYTDGSSSSWTQYCADQFDAVNNPPLPPGANGGGGAVAGPCDSGQQGVITYTPDGRKQQCSYGHWVYIA
jgi:hypothetical protein